MAPPPAGLPIAPSTPRNHNSSHHRLSSWLLGLPHHSPPPFRLRSRSLHGFPRCTLHSTLVCSMSCNLRYPHFVRDVCCQPSGPPSGCLNILSSGCELQSLLDTRVGCCPALDKAQLSSGGQAKGHLQPLCRPLLGPLARRGHTTVRSTLRLGTAPKRPQTRPPAHPWTDRQPPAWAIACF